MNLAKMLIGTSGYSFADWVGVFYPENIAKGKMLDYYKDHFKTVEINSTYYRIPHAAVFYNMQKKFERAPGSIPLVVQILAG
jgi:uncharacterized protein YecE (DUF72 family)